MPNDPDPIAALLREDDTAAETAESEPLQRIRVAAAARATLLQGERHRLDADLDRLRSKAGA